VSVNEVQACLQPREPVVWFGIRQGQAGQPSLLFRMTAQTAMAPQGQGNRISDSSAALRSRTGGVIDGSSQLASWHYLPPQ